MLQQVFLRFLILGSIVTYLLYKDRNKPKSTFDEVRNVSLVITTVLAIIYPLFMGNKLWSTFYPIWQMLFYSIIIIEVVQRMLS